MKNPKIDSINAVCALLEEINRWYNFFEYEDRERMKEAIKFLDSLIEPEPLDPRTCELREGDTCKIISVTHIASEKLTRYIGAITEVVYCDAHLVRVKTPIPSPGGHNYHTLNRSDLILTQRAGVQIETK